MQYEEVFVNHSELSTDKWEIYLETYSEIFAPYEGSPVRLLEIGVQNGGSLQIYSDFFSPDSLIIGCDIDPRVSDLNFNRKNIRTVIGNACDDGTLEKILKLEASFDFVIDDGSHNSRDIIEAFRMYFPSLQFGGVYIAEDLHCSYEYGYGGGLLYRQSSFEFFKILIDIVNREHWPIGRESKRFASKFVRNYGFSPEDDFLRDIHSIEFKNSMVIIKKKIPTDNELGQRISSGVVTQVTSANNSFAGMKRTEFVFNKSSNLLLLKRYVKDLVKRFF